MKIELASIPSTQIDRIDGFMSGVNAALNHMPNQSGNEPMTVDLEFRASGNCHIHLLVGRWVGSTEADFSNCEGGVQ
jgi:hypothetical protein